MVIKDFDRIQHIIEQLRNDFAYAVHQSHARNGGLIGLAAAAIALGSVRARFERRGMQFVVPSHITLENDGRSAR